MILCDFSLPYEIVKDYLAVVAICIYSLTRLDLSIRFNAISKYDCYSGILVNHFIQTEVGTWFNLFID